MKPGVMALQGSKPVCLQDRGWQADGADSTRGRENGPFVSVAAR